MPFWTLGLPCSIVCSVSFRLFAPHVPIMPDSSVQQNYSELQISSRPTQSLPDTSDFWFQEKKLKLWAISNPFGLQRLFNTWTMSLKLKENCRSPVCYHLLGSSASFSCCLHKMKTRKRAKPSTDIAIWIKPYISFKKSREVTPKG